ncbi:MAG: isoprenyl transferase [Alphaproteobacteria bacterium]
MSLQLMKTPQAASQNLPAHIAVIMDGNGRWANAKGLPRSAGHKKGAESLRRTLRFCRDAGVKYLTVYAFSAENWQRPEAEITELMQLLRHYLKHEIEELMKNKIRLRFIGDFLQLPEDICELIANTMEQTAAYQDFTLTIALSYGGRQEITSAAKMLVNLVMNGQIALDNVDEAFMSELMFAGRGDDAPEPDLLIRTGGEQRISNFLLWQCAYTEFYFTDTLWPDFDLKDFNHALEEFSTRERRYGNA